MSRGKQIIPTQCSSCGGACGKGPCEYGKNRDKNLYRCVCGSTKYELLKYGDTHGAIRCAKCSRTGLMWKVLK